MARQKAAFAGKTEPKVGQKGTVFSRSAGQWLKCVVVAVGGDEARVKYKLQGQIGEKYVYWGDETEFKLGSGEAAATTERQHPASAAGRSTASVSSHGSRA